MVTSAIQFLNLTNKKPINFQKLVYCLFLLFFITKNNTKYVVKAPIENVTKWESKNRVNTLSIPSPTTAKDSGRYILSTSILRSHPPTNEIISPVKK